MVDIEGPGKPFKFVILGFILWVVIDLGTAGGFRLSYFSAHGPTLLFFYIGHPLILTYLIFRRHWSGWKLFITILASIILIEGILTDNPFVCSFPLMLVGIPLAICIYAPLTYFPLWIVNREMASHRGVVLFLSMIVLAVMLLTTFGETSSQPQVDDPRAYTSTHCEYRGNPEKLLANASTGCPRPQWLQDTYQFKANHAARFTLLVVSRFHEQEGPGMNIAAIEGVIT